MNDVGTRCVTVHELRMRRGHDNYDGPRYSGRWAKVHKANCYEVYFGGTIECWFRVSGPHHLDSGESDIAQGRAFYM